MQAVRVSVSNSFPLQFVFMIDGSIVVEYKQGVCATISVGDKIDAHIFPDKLRLYEIGYEEPLEYSYLTAYKIAEVPVLKAWLVQLELINPF